mmetsp:Transcript_36076/g.103749  ORF Transcript_36076/g.103749 Transcript_36076/m.103749 type:complete len:327 (-) Transcript_36076:371-1351(-)
MPGDRSEIASSTGHLDLNHRFCGLRARRDFDEHGARMPRSCEQHTLFAPCRDILAHHGHSGEKHRHLEEREGRIAGDGHRQRVGGNESNGIADVLHERVELLYAEIANPLPEAQRRGDKECPRIPHAVGAAKEVSGIIPLVPTNEQVAEIGSGHAANRCLCHLNVDLLRGCYWGRGPLLFLEAMLAIDTAQNRKADLRQGQDDAYYVVLTRSHATSAAFLFLTSLPVVGTEAVDSTEDGQQEQDAHLLTGLPHPTHDAASSCARQQPRLGDHCIHCRVKPGNGEHLADVSQSPSCARRRNAGGVTDVKASEYRAATAEACAEEKTC